MTASRGFTLVEVLIALMIFSVISVSGIALLSQSLNAHQQTESLNILLQDVQRTRALLKADLSQVAGRSVRDPYGTGNGFVFSGGRQVGTDSILQLVRDGWENPAGLERRSSLQRVEYALDDGNLIRRVYMRLDPTTGTAMVDQVVLSGVERVDILFYRGGQWFPVWATANPEAATFPEAVALEFTVERLGDLRQVFLTSGFST